jgi:hypothetical protein
MIWEFGKEIFSARQNTRPLRFRDFPKQGYSGALDATTPRLAMLSSFLSEGTALT